MITTTAATTRGGAPAPASDMPTDRPTRLEPGTRVEVRTRLDTRRWAKGFEVVDAVPSGYRLRRMTDGEVMPVVFSPDDVRAERKGGTWWY